MGALSDSAKNSLLDALARSVAYSNAAVWAKLHTGAPGSAGTSNAATETTRQQLTFGSAAASRLISNTTVTEWTNVSTSETYTHVSLWTANAAGTFLGSDALPSGIAVTAGDNFRIAIGDVDVGIGGTQFSDGVANSMLDAVFRNVSFDIAAVWVKLHTGDPGSAGTSNAATETTRKQGTFGNAAASGAITTTAATTWTNVSTGETYTWISLWDASSGGTFLGRDDLSSSAAVNAGDTFELPTGDLDLSLSGTVP